VVEHVEEIVLMCCILNLSVIETGQKLNLSSAENVYSSENVESRGSKLKVPVGNETCLQRKISAHCRSFICRFHYIHFLVVFSFITLYIVGIINL